MTRSTRAIAAALAALAIGAPAATAMPSREYVSAPSREAATAAPQQDRRGTVARDASVMPETGSAAAAAQAANGTTIAPGWFGRKPPGTRVTPESGPPRRTGPVVPGRPAPDAAGTGPVVAGRPAPDAAGTRERCLRGRR
jgi:hypothetical protein